MSLPSRNDASRSGASRKSKRRAGRRGVDDDQVPPATSAEPLRAAARASPSPCTPGCPRTSWTAPGRRGSPVSAETCLGPRGTPRPRRTSASCRASSRRGCRRGSRPCPTTARGTLSSSDSPIDCASRRAGSIVSTTTLRPCSAARRPSAADVVVLPTPPEPQHTMIRTSGSASSASVSRWGTSESRAASGPTRGRPPLRAVCPSGRPSEACGACQNPLSQRSSARSYRRAEVDAVREVRQRDDRSARFFEERALLSLEGDPLGMLSTDQHQAGDCRLVGADARLLQADLDRGGIELTAAAAATGRRETARADGPG